MRSKMMRKLITNLNGNNNRIVLLLFCLFQILFLTQVRAQSLTIQGKVISSRYPVKYASITFINSADTTNKFSALTDALGNYQINLSITSVKPVNSLPTKFKLEQSYPNPFSSTADIPYGLKKESNIQVIIYDILGRVVRKFEVGRQSVGTHNILWDGRNDFGQRVASGVYFYRLNADGESQVKKMVFNSNGNDFVSLPHSYSLTENSFSTLANKT